MINRSELINSLAASMGVAGAKQHVPDRDTYYDASTGTLYCKDKSLADNIADVALAYFEKLEANCDGLDYESRKLALIYRCAIDAIKEKVSNEG